MAELRLQLRQMRQLQVRPGVPRGRCPLTRSPPPPAASRSPGRTASCRWPSLQHPLVRMTEGQGAGACHPGLLPHTHHLGLEPSAAATVYSHFFKLRVLLTHEKTIKHLLFFFFPFFFFFLRRAGSRGAPWWCSHSQLRLPASWGLAFALPP